MALPAPNLDDRRFQDLVDDAKRLVQARCPDWTDHNVSDPGVTLIETFALMVDQLLYRLNRVPDRLYVKFLELIGVRLRPPSAARTEVTFTLSAPQAETVRVPSRTEVATLRTETVDAVSFVTVQPADALPTTLAHAASGGPEGEVTDRDNDLRGAKTFGAFSARPQPDDCLYIGLDKAAPWCVVTLRFQCSVSGVGVDPDNPPLVWEAALADGQWVRCDVDRDDTKGFNQPGDVVLHVSPRHAATVVGSRSAGWLRCRLLAVGADQPTYSEAPLIHGVEAFTTGVDCPAIHAQFEVNEGIGTSDGTAGQRFLLAHAPVVPANEPFVLQVAEAPEAAQADAADPNRAERGWVDWTEVDDFAASSGEDRHFSVDLANGEVSFGPAVRLANGGIGQFGRIPPHGARIRMAWYWHGGGSRGNVGPHRIEVLKSPVRLVRAVTNRRSAAGGVDPESIEEAKARGPIELRTIDRAVTAEDYELLVRRAAPEIARVKCLTSEEHGQTGAVHVLLVPHSASNPSEASEEGLIPFEYFEVNDDLRERVRRELDERRMVSTRLVVDEPVYQWVTIVAKVRAVPGIRAASLELALHRAVHNYLNPVTGGPDARGWPFGRPLHMGEAYAILQRVPGVEFVELVRLFIVDPATQRPREEVPRLVLAAHELVYSFRHDILVEEP